MMKTLIYVPIEPLVERYTESWYRNFPILFKRAGFNVMTIPGRTLQSEVKVGTFLDINSTVHYKMTQLQNIASLFNDGLIPQGSVFFIADTEFWGLESIRLMAQMNKVQVYITSFLHAASYTREDAFEIAEPYQRFTEVGWIAACDLVFVGSEYHKTAVIERRLAPVSRKTLADRILVTKNPLFLEDYPLTNQRNQIAKQKKFLLTNRFDVEKRPLETLEMFAALKTKYPAWEFVVTTSRSTLRSNHPLYVGIAREMEIKGIITIKDGLTKAQYHQELAEATCMVSHSIEENYGYCIAEALLHGCHVVLRKGLSHDEFVPTEFLFHSTKECFDVCEEIIREFHEKTLYDPPKVDVNGADNIVRAIQELEG
jgi:glycosyltransferase involved in cell wall biosynthesis